MNTKLKAVKLKNNSNFINYFNKTNSNKKIGIKSEGIT
jgi:hypothetical protein